MSDRIDHISVILRPNLTIDRAMLMRLAHRKATARCVPVAASRFFPALPAPAYRECLAQAMREVWGFVQGAREIEAIKRQRANEPYDRRAVLQRELAAVTFIENTAVMLRRKAVIEAELVQFAA